VPHSWRRQWLLGEEAGGGGLLYKSWKGITPPGEGEVNTLVIPVWVLVADGHCRKRHTVFEVHTDVDVLGIGDEISDFSGNHVGEDSAGREDDQ